MRDTLSSACKKYGEYYDMAKTAFRKERVHLYAPCAGILLGKNVEVDKQMFQDTWQVIKAQDGGLFSTVRGAARIGLVAMLTDCRKQEQRVTDFNEALAVLRKQFVNSPYILLAAMAMAEAVEKDCYREITAQANSMFDHIRSTYPLLAYDEEIIYCVLMAMAGKTKEDFGAELDTYMNLLKGTFKAGVGAMDLALVLMLISGDPEVNTKKVLDIYQGLKDKGVKYGTERELATLGALAAYSASADQIVSDLMEVYAEIGKRKEYGLLGFDKRWRILHAGIIVEAEYRRSEEAKDPEVAATVARINAEIRAEKLEELRAQKLAEAKASLKEGQVLEVEPVTEEDLELEDDRNYHPHIKDLLYVLAAQQASIGIALKNKAGAVAAYANANSK